MMHFPRGSSIGQAPGITGVGSFVTFSEIAFNFRVSPAIMLAGLAFALFMGAVGGLFPARSAARKEILTALREV